MSRLYVGAVSVPMDDEGHTAETVMAGVRYGVYQATVEHEVAAVPNLVRLCDEIATTKGLSWRLLLFDQAGIHELNPEDYREYEDYCQRRGLGT